MSQDTEELRGWNGIIRIGDTIRRPPRTWSRTVQALLRHLEIHGFGGAPKALQFDEQGREILSYLPGSAEHYPWRAFVYSEDNLYRVARLLCRYHQATISFIESNDAVWSADIPGAAEVICHGDIGPYNTIYVNKKAVGFIDFETAAPGPRLWDVAFAVYRFAPLCELSGVTHMTDARLDQIAQRIDRFCDYYGLGERTCLLDVVRQRLEFQVAWLHSPENSGTQSRVTVEEHAAFYQRDLVAIDRHASQLESYL
jgi:Ser/Thr protein kinase RdoA (MazF antagonist)